MQSTLVDTEDEIPDFVEFVSSDKNMGNNESVTEVKEIIKMLWGCVARTQCHSLRSWKPL